MRAGSFPRLRVSIQGEPRTSPSGSGGGLAAPVGPCGPFRSKLRSVPGNCRGEPRQSPFGFLPRPCGLFRFPGSESGLAAFGFALRVSLSGLAASDQFPETGSALRLFLSRVGSRSKPEGLSPATRPQKPVRHCCHSSLSGFAVLRPRVRFRGLRPESGVGLRLHDDLALLPIFVPDRISKLHSCEISRFLRSASSRSSVRFRPGLPGPKHETDSLCRVAPAESGGFCLWITWITGISRLKLDPHPLGKENGPAPGERGRSCRACIRGGSAPKRPS